MPGHLEPLSAVLRIGGAYGEPYTWAATVRYRSRTDVELVGVTTAPTPSEWRSIAATLRAGGIQTVAFVRQKRGKWIAHRIVLG